MANILMIPASGAIIFDSQSPNFSGISPLSAAPRLSYDNAGGLNISSYTTGESFLDRFTVDGSYGRLFGVSDSVTGVVFSVNDAAGLPIVEVESNFTDKIIKLVLVIPRQRPNSTSPKLGIVISPSRAQAARVRLRPLLSPRKVPR